MKKRSILISVLMLFIVSLVLVACGGNDKEVDAGKK